MAGVVGFPRIKTEIKLNIDTFYRVLFEQYKTIVGPGHWFEQEDSYMRIGFGYPHAEELQQGLKNIAASIEAAIIP